MLLVRVPWADRIMALPFLTLLAPSKRFYEGKPREHKTLLDWARQAATANPPLARSVLYHRLPRLFDALALARGDGRHARLLKTLSRVDLLILDDWGLVPVTLDQARDLLEIVDDRHGRGSTIVTTQLPIEHWHEMIPNPTIADAILDRLVHNAHRLILIGESMRKPPANRFGLDVKQDA